MLSICFEEVVTIEVLKRVERMRSRLASDSEIFREIPKNTQL